MRLNLLVSYAAIACLLSVSPSRAGDTNAVTQADLSRKNLQQIALAFHNFHEEHGHLPGYANVDNDGKPLLS